MTRLLTRLLTVVGLLFLVLLPARADVSAYNDDAALLRQIHRNLAGKVSASQLQAWDREVTAITERAAACNKNNTAILENIDKSLQIIGPTVSGEASELLQLRHSLETHRTAINGKLATCKVLQVGGNMLLTKIRAQENSLKTQQLLVRGPNLLAQIQELGFLPRTLWTQEDSFWLHRQGRLLFSEPAVQGSWGLGIALVWIGLVLRRNSQHHLRELFLLPALLLWAVLAKTLDALVPLTILVLVSASAYVISTWLGKSLLRHLANFPNRAQREALLLRVLWRPLRFIITVGTFLLTYAHLDPQGSAVFYRHAILLTAIHTLVMAAFIWGVWRARRFTFLGQWRWLQGLLFGSAAALILIDFLGYLQLANYLIRGLVISMVAIVLARLVSWFLEDVWGLEDDEENALLPRKLRRYFGLSAQEGSLWLAWIRFFSFALLWGLTLIVVLMAWGLSRSGFTLIWQYFVRGFTVGDFHVQPFRWVIALALLFALIQLNQWLQNRLASVRGPFRHLDIGSRHSILAILRYAGFVIATLLALSTAGVALHNLAIIAGALSLGIGFGLQNIVNNFVSGLILLLERPIRVGDWVKVGNTEGYVQRLSIRSTLILTFDRTEVFVPNSELISGQVTNWTYSNHVLRLMIPLRVRHDADIDTVRSILEAVGRSHPEVLQDDPRGLPPTALLLDVTENALVFYLRVYIEDCNNSFLIQTELRAKAVEALYRNHIGLAHQQQDLYFPERSMERERPPRNAP